MTEEGFVKKIGNGSVVIEIKTHSECTACKACGAGRPREMVLSAAEYPGLKIGDHVKIEIESGVMVKVYCILYGVPLLVFAGLLFALYAITEDPLKSFLPAILGTAITFLIIGGYFRKNPGLSPTVTKIE